MRIDIVTIFPEFFDVLDVSLVGKARESGLVKIDATNLRDFTHDVHKTVDDSPYGGGAGMVMRPEPWGEALDSLVADDTVLIIPSPAGEVFTQPIARELSLEFVNLDTRARARRPAVGALDREGRALGSRVPIDELIGQLGRAAHRLGTPQLRGEREIT